MNDTSVRSSDIAARQNEVLIGLLARATIGVTSIYDIVTKAKKNPEGYVKAYNSLTGGRGVTEVAKIAGVSQPTMTTTLQAWEAAGIIYDLGEPHKPDYRRLLVLPAKRPADKGAMNG